MSQCVKASSHHIHTTRARARTCVTWHASPRAPHIMSMPSTMCQFQFTKQYQGKALQQGVGVTCPKRYKCELRRKKINAHSHDPDDECSALSIDRTTTLSIQTRYICYFRLTMPLVTNSKILACVVIWYHTRDMGETKWWISV